MPRWPSSPRARLAAAGGALAVLLAAVIVLMVRGGQYETEQSATLSFTMPENFTVVRKILVRRDGAQQLVAMGGSEFLSQSWSQAGGEVESLQLLDPKWRLQLRGVLRVRTNDDYIGQQEIGLAQEVTITPDLLHSQVALQEPAERLRDYRMTTHFDRDDATGTTRVELTLAQRILTHAPWFAHGIADRRVRESVERTLARQQEAIRRLIADNLDDVPLLPLR